MTSRDELIERVRKLLAMASDVSSPNEAAIAAKRARKIMDTHFITADELKDPSSFGHKGVGGARKFVAKWEQSIAIAIADLNDCVVGYDYVDGEYRRISFRGYVADVKLCEFMFVLITCAAIKGSSSISTVNGRYSARIGTVYKERYAIEVVKRIEAIAKERKVMLASTGKELMLVAKIEEVQAFFGATNRKTRAVAPIKNSDELAAARLGEQHGKSVNIQAELS